MLLSLSLTCVKLLTLLLVTGFTTACNASKATNVTDDNLASHTTICWLQLYETVICQKMAG